MNNDSVNIRVKYIPDTSELRNIKELKAPEIKIGGKNIGKNIFESYNAAVRELNKEMSKGANASTMSKGFKNIEAEASKAKIQINNMIDAINKSFQSPGNQALIKDYENLIKQSKKLEEESKKRRAKTSELSQYKSQTKMSTPQARKEISKAEALVTAGEKLTKQDQERLDIAKQIIAKEEELAKLRTQEEIRSAQRDVKAQMEDPKFAVMVTSEDAAKANNELAESNTKLSISYNDAATNGSKMLQVTQQQEQTAKKAKKEVLKFGDIISGTFLGTSLSNLFQTGLSKGIQFFKDYDETLTRTMMVTGMTRDEVNNLTSSYNDLANQLSSTTKDVAAAQLVFYQQGLSTKEALAMTEASIAVSKTGGIEAAEAADRLTAAVRGYQLAETEAMELADKMSALDAAAASSVDELTVAMQKSASQARMAGLDLDYYMAYLSTMQEVTREAPENIGTAMKSITSRLQEIKDIGKVEEDGTTFSNVAKALNSIGIAALDSSGQLRTLQDIMNELGPMWETLDRNHQAYIATVLAGNRQQSRFIALMDNYDRAMELVDISQNASGESARQLRAYNEGLEASFTRLSNAWQQFATNIADSSTIKGIIDLFSSFIELLNKIPKRVTSAVVPLLALTKVFTTLSKAGNLFKGFKAWSIEKLGLKDISTDIGLLGKGFQDIGNKAGVAWNSVKRFIDGFGNNKYIKEYNDAIEKNTELMSINTTGRLGAEQAKITEGNSSTSLAATEDVLSASYDLVTDSITRNEKALQSNDDEMLLEQDDAYRVAKQNLGWVTENEKIAKQEIENIKERVQKSVLAKEDEYHTLTTSSKLGNVLIKSYLDSLGMNTEGLKISQQMFDDNYEAAKNWLRKKVDREVKVLKEQATEEMLGLTERISELDTQSSDLRKVMAKIKKERGYSYDKGDLRGDSLPGAKELDSFLKKKTASFGETWAFISDKNIGNLDKITGVLGKLNISGGLVAGSLTQMGSSFLGLDDDMSSALSTSVGLATTFAKFAPPWGAIIGASIGVVQLIFDKLTVSVEEAKEKLEELNKEQDQLSTKQGSISNALNTYNELRNKIDLTEEEQQELNSSANELAELIPSAVHGYDEMGNAIITVSRAQEELNSIMREQVSLAKQEMTTLDDLQEASDGWDFTRWLIEGLPWNWGNNITASEKQAQDRAAVVSEYAADINDYFTTLRDSLSKEMDDTEKQIFNNISGVFRTSLMERMLSQDPDKQMGIKEATLKYSELLKVFTDQLDISELEDAITRLDYVFDFGDYEFGEASDRVRKEIEDLLTGAGYNTEEIDQIINVVLEMTLEGGDAVVQALDTLNQKRKEILAIDKEDRTVADNRTLQNIEYLTKEIEGAKVETVELMSKFGLLDTSAAGFIKAQGGIEKIADSFRNTDGEIETTYTNMEKLNDVYERTTELEEKRDKLRSDIKSGDLTWSGDTSLSKLIKEEKVGSFWDLWDFDYKNIINELLKEFKGGAISQEDVKGVAESVLGYETSDKNIEKIEDLYNKYVSLSDQSQELAEVNDELKIQGNLVKIIAQSYPEEPGFDTMKASLDEAISNAETLSGLLEELADKNNTLSAQNVSDIFGLMDGLEKSFKNGAIDTSVWASNMSALADGFTVVNGEMKLTEEGQQALVNLQIESVRATYRSQLADLEATEAKLTNQKSIMQAYLASLKTTLSNIEKEGKAKYDESDAEEQMATNLGKYLDQQTWAQVTNTQQALNEMLNSYQQFFTQIDQMYTQAQKGEIVTFKDIKTDNKSIYDNIMKPIKERYQQGIIQSSYEETVSNLKAEIADVEKVIEGIDSQISGVQIKKTFAEYMSKSDNIGDFLSGAEDAADDLSDYNEKLERTLTLLEKIEGIQHKIDENETFKDLYKEYSGEDYGRLLMKNLNLSKEQYSAYKDLFAMQQEMTNQAAGDLLDSTYGQLFKIMENGDIGWADTSMYDKYKNLPGDMKEDIDNLVEAYQKQRDELRSTEKELSKYAQEIKKVREELVEMQIEIENELVDAVKNREQILHNARQKALDDEISMIEKAVEARNKAREKEDQGKELYKAQEALRRATLDSSGKNNAQLLQLQQDLEDKQLEIADKRFEEDMDDRKQWLQDTKDAETETYEYRLETMTWYWEQVQEIQAAGTEEMMKTLMTWNEQYRQTSETQQKEMARKWQETMDAMKAATDFGAELGELTDGIVDVTREVENMDIKVQALPGTWKKATDAANAYADAARKAARYSRLKNTDDKDKDDDNDDSSENPTDTSVPFSPYYGVGRTLQVGNKLAKTYLEKNGKLQEFKNTATNRGTQLPSQVTVKETKEFNGELYIKVRNMVGKDVWVSAKDLTSLAGGGRSGGRAFATGGMVDYTGPAWVDGTKTRPEAFLSAYQTEQIGALAKALDTSTINNATANSTVTFGSINFNVASMSSAADGRKALDIFVQGANDMMAKKGIGTKLNLNVK